MMINALTQDKPDTLIPITLLASYEWAAWLNEQSDFVKRWCAANHFTAIPEQLCLIPHPSGELSRVLWGVEREHMDKAGDLATRLPEGVYALETFDEEVALAWALQSYDFSTYKTGDPKSCATLYVPDYGALAETVKSIFLVRDLINTPANDMMPQHMAKVVSDLAAEFGAVFEQTIGDDLLKTNFPAIHTVGRASEHVPRLLSLRWGDPADPKVTLVGKGVCFDSGGLDLKSSSGMLLMKKDMGGAAHVIGLARLIMAMKLKLCLRVLIPAVENAVGSASYRPGDVIRCRNGKTVEVGNTDCEGRLVLADALALAVEDKPDYIIDFATLTGAARVAVGTEIAALFSNNEDLASGLLQASAQTKDPIWRLPLFEGYRKQVEGEVGDLTNCPSGMAGACTAALFLEAFVGECAWAHYDLMAWNTNSRPGHPKGGEAMALRATYHYLQTL